MTHRKRALITGITGQDGHYMTALLRGNGYEVIGINRRAGDIVRADAADRWQHWDMRDDEMIRQILSDEQPEEVYNFAAFSTGAGMFDDPVAIGEINGLAVTRMLEAIRLVTPDTRFCQASSAEMFGAASGSPQDETSSFDPRSPYGVAKLYAHQTIGLYRQRFGIFGCSAILFNHESPLRGAAFVTCKITAAAAAISLGLADHVVLGNLSARRDWGFAGDYVRAMWRMLQHNRPDDYVIATGVTHSVADLCNLAFAHVGLDYRDHVRVEEQAYRAPEPLQLVGHAHKASRELGWTADMMFEQLVAGMVDAHLARLAQEEVSIPR